MATLRTMPKSILLAILFVIGAGSSALAFDCNQASTPTEIAICSNDQLLSADKTMAKAFFKLKAMLDKNNAKALLTSQRNWLKMRDSMCDAQVDCLIEQTQLWTKSLRDGDAGITTMLKFQEGDKNHYRVTVRTPKYFNPSESGQFAFNRLMKGLFADAPFDEVTEDQQIGNWEWEQDVEITWRSKALISANIATYEYAGGAHPNSWRSSLNIDMKTGVQLTARDLFTDAGVRRLTQLCTDQIVKEKSERHSEDLEKARRTLLDEYGQTIADKVEKFDTGYFNLQGATLIFNAYDIGAYAEGSYQCEFDWATIRQAARDTSAF